MLTDIAMSPQRSQAICVRKILSQEAFLNNKLQISKEDLVGARFRLSCNMPPRIKTACHWTMA